LFCVPPKDRTTEVHRDLSGDLIEKGVTMSRTHVAWHIDASGFHWLAASLAEYWRLPFDADLVRSRFTPPYGIPALIEVLDALGLQAGILSWQEASWEELPLPAVAFRGGGEQGVEPSAEADTDGPGLLTPVLIVGSDAGLLSLVRPGQHEPQRISIENFRKQAAPLLLLVREAEPPVTEDAAATASEASEGKAFGFSWFVPELLRHRTIWRDVLLASLAIQLVALAMPLFTQVIIDKVIAHHSESTLIVLGVALVAFMLFTAVMSWLRQYLVLHTGCRVDAVLGEKVLRHLLRLPIPYFERRPTGTLVARLHGIETLREFVSGAAVSLLLDLPFLAIFLAVMFAYSWQLTLIAVGLILLIALASLVMVPVFRRRLDRQFLLGARNQAFLTEYLSGIDTVKSLQLEPEADKRYAAYLAPYLSASFATRQVGNTYQVVSSALEQTMMLSILIAGAWYVMQDTGFTVGMLVAFQMFASRLSQPVMRLVGLWQEFQQASVAVRRLADILDMPQEPVTLVPRRAMQGRGKIEIKDLAFRYSERYPWLYRDLNLMIEPGKLTVIMGPSGCGKSTLAKLLLGFYLPQEGTILIDGCDIRSLAANELRQWFGVVPQEVFLFSGTIYDNLVMASPDASFEDVIAACRAAEIHDVIEKLPKGYRTEIGERGVGLSGGQRQRIAIARALLKRPKVLIFDEAVSSLDRHTAEHLAVTVNRLRGKVSIIFITHQIPHGLEVDEIVNLGLLAAPKHRAAKEGEG